MPTRRDLVVALGKRPGGLLPNGNAAVREALTDDLERLAASFRSVTVVRADAGGRAQRCR